eukprot:gene22973-biopygen10304
MRAPLAGEGPLLSPRGRYTLPATRGAGGAVWATGRRVPEQQVMEFPAAGPSPRTLTGACIVGSLAPARPSEHPRGIPEFEKSQNSIKMPVIHRFGSKTSVGRLVELGVIYESSGMPRGNCWRSGVHRAATSRIYERRGKSKDFNPGGGGGAGFSNFGIPRGCSLGLAGANDPTIQAPVRVRGDGPAAGNSITCCSGTRRPVAQTAPPAPRVAGSVYRPRGESKGPSPANGTRISPPLRREKQKSRISPQWGAILALIPGAGGGGRHILWPPQSHGSARTTPHPLLPRLRGRRAGVFGRGPPPGGNGSGRGRSAR